MWMCMQGSVTFHLWQNLWGKNIDVKLTISITAFYCVPNLLSYVKYSIEFGCKANPGNIFYRYPSQIYSLEWNPIGWCRSCDWYEQQLSACQWMLWTQQDPILSSWWEIQWISHRRASQDGHHFRPQQMVVGSKQQNVVWAPGKFIVCCFTIYLTNLFFCFRYYIYDSDVTAPPTGYHHCEPLLMGWIMEKQQQQLMGNNND